METLSQHRCFNGTLSYYKHASTRTKCDMRFTAYVPDNATGAGLIYLSGLTCTEDNFTVKAGAYRVASQLGLMVFAPDTSPRGDDVADDESIAIGKGAGWYVNATQAPWSTHYNMYDYCAEEFPALIAEKFNTKKLSLMGHSMGGHGTLTIALKNPEKFSSLSVLAPVCTPSQTDWGQSALRTYFGDDPAEWAKHDATALMAKSNGKLPPILIDQGLADTAYVEGRLNADAFVSACKAVGQPVELRKHAGYDHGYFFIQSFIDDHLRYHANALGSAD